MPEYLYPGVYIEEIERGPRPIEGVPTSTAAFLGETERGTLEPTLVTSYREYQRQFGGVFGNDKFMPYAVSGFFENGGKRLYVCRIADETAVASSVTLGTLTARAVGPGTWGDNIFVQVAATESGTPGAFTLAVGYYATAPAQAPTSLIKPPASPAPSQLEVFDDLVLDEASPNYYDKRVNSSSTLVKVTIPPGAAPPGEDIAKLSGGGAGTGPLNDADYKGELIGARTQAQGLSLLKLDPYREVALVYAPGVDYTIAQALVTYCESSRFCFAAVDCARDMPLNILPRNAVTDTQYAAFYYPWIQVSDPQTGARKLVPPGGHVLGIYARTDTERGVSKAPANEVVRGALDLYRDTDDATQGVLNPKGVNAIRDFPGRGIRLWGARTLSSNALWKYVSVRRLFIFLEHSIYDGTQWVVFEPNDDRLWARVVDTIRLFLRGQWRLGALLGRTEAEAFFVTCDRTTMTQDDILNGRLVCEIGIAPVRPAEFVIFRIFQNTAEAQR